MPKVRFEFLPSLAETLGVEQMGEESMSDAGDGGSLLGLLNRLASQYELFNQIVFDTKTQKLTGRVAIFLNGRTLDAESGLNTKLKDGDRLIFAQTIEGG